MSQTEERLRAATRALARTVPDDGVPSLHLPVADRSGRPTRPRQSGSRPRRWLTPAAAAAAVIAIVAVSVTVAGHNPRPPAPARSDHGAAPAYYVTLTLTNQKPARGAPDPDAAVVRSTTSGLAQATISPPAHSTFVAAAGAGDGRTFILAASTVRGNATFPGTPIEFYRLRFSPGQDTAQLTRLPVSAEPAGTTLYGMALSPAGDRLAVAASRESRSSVQVFDLRTGAVRSWQANGGAFGPANTAYPRAVTWVRSGTEVAFSWQDPDAPGQCLSAGNANSVRLLNPAARGSDLVAASTLGARVPASLGGCIDGWAQVTGNGRTVIAPVARFNQKTDQNFVAFARLPVGGRGRVSTFLGLRYHDNVDWFQYVLWAGPAGQTVIIVQAPGLGYSAGPETYARGRLQALPFPLPGTMSAAW
jgi:hypothetical protein